MDPLNSRDGHVPYIEKSNKKDNPIVGKVSEKSNIKGKEREQAIRFLSNIQLTTKSSQKETSSVPASQKDMSVDKVTKDNESKKIKSPQIKHLFSQQVDYNGFREKVIEKILKKDPENKSNEKEIENFFDKVVAQYEERFLEANPEMNSKKYLQSIKFIALVCAVKIFSDELNLTNTEILKILHPSTAWIHKALNAMSLTRLEMEFLKAINWNLSIDWNPKRS